METEVTNPADTSSLTVEEQVNRIKTRLDQFIRLSRLNLDVCSRRMPLDPQQPDAPEWMVEFSGADSDLLVEARAELLDALAYVASKAARLDERLHSKIIFDCRDYRKSRAEELKLTAQLAAERVIESGEPFALNPMNAIDRRTVHLALKDHTAVRTESQGMGSARKVVILPAATP